MNYLTPTHKELIIQLLDEDSVETVEDLIKTLQSLTVTVTFNGKTLEF